MAAQLTESMNPMPILAAATVAANSFYLLNGILFFCPEAIANGAVGAGYWRHKKVRGAAKATGQVWAIGAKLYWDDTAKNWTTTAASNTVRGFAAEAALIGDATGAIELLQIPV